MASSVSHLLEIHEQFCQCPICLQQYKEPKQLPCLHRYCRDCLEQLIKNNEGTNMITCPECRREFEVTEAGVDGFKTDFYINNVIEYIQLQKSLADEQVRQCCDCLKKIKVTAYCFKCNDFLCTDCHNSHVTKKMLKDHKQHTLSLEDIKSKNMTLENLAALKDAPRCHDHPEDISKLCCETCNNLPICLTCTYGSHENHKVKDVNVLATAEKKKLNEQLEILNQYKERMYRIPETVDKVKKELILNVNEEKKFCQKTYERKINAIETEMKHTEENKTIQETEIKTEQSKSLSETLKNMERELEEVRKKYDVICDGIRRINENKLRKLTVKHDKQLQENKERLRSLEKEHQTLMTSIDKRRSELEKQLKEITLHTEGTAKRFENLTTTARCILVAGNQWTAVQCIPDLLSASEPLSAEMKREFPELEMMSKLGIGVEVVVNELSPVNIEGTEANEVFINGITHSGDGNVVVTGNTAISYCSHITVISTEGKILQQKKLSGLGCISLRFCAYLKQFKIVTVCWRDEIGIYDVRDGSYIKKNVSDIVSSWQEDRSVFCVATDPVNNHIFVGGFQSRDVYVFDDQLNYLRIITLPEVVDYPRCITVSDGSLLQALYYSGPRAYVVSVDGLHGELLYEFTSPVIDEDDWEPVSVCTDKNGLVYMLWERRVGERRCLLVEYSQAGRKILTRKPVNSDVRHVAIVQTVETEKLVMTTGELNKLYIYFLGSCTNRI